MIQDYPAAAPHIQPLIESLFICRWRVRTALGPPVNAAAICHCRVRALGATPSAWGAVPNDTERGADDRGTSGVP